MEQGIVKWFDAKKGYGFIKQDEGEDLFVHHSSIKMTGFRRLNQGDKVEFSTEESGKGLTAKDVNVLEYAPQEGVQEQSA